MFKTIKKMIFHDIKRLSISTFRCKRCNKYFSMNLTHRAEIDEEQAMEEMKMNREFLENYIKENIPEQYNEWKRMNFNEPGVLLEDLTISQRICWRKHANFKHNTRNNV